MRTAKLTGVVAVAALALAATPASAATVASEDFEAGASGWSDNTTETPAANAAGFTRHLGRHGVGGTTAKTFALSGSQSQVSVAFDFYRFDSWDGEFFSATISDGTNSFTSSTQAFFNDPAAANVYNPGWGDSIRPITFDFVTTAGSVTLTFSSTLDQHFGDEAWGVDNLLITDNVNGVPGIPEPSAWALLILGFGVVGGALRRTRKQRSALTYA